MATKKEELIPVTHKFPSDLWQDVKDAAAQLDLSAAQAVRQALREWLVRVNYVRKGKR